MRYVTVISYETSLSAPLADIVLIHLMTVFSCLVRAVGDTRVNESELVVGSGGKGGPLKERRKHDSKDSGAARRLVMWNKNHVESSW